MKNYSSAFREVLGRNPGFVLVVLMFLTSTVWAVPNTIRFQGRLTDAKGAPIVAKNPGDTVEVGFQLYTGEGVKAWPTGSVPYKVNVPTNDAGLFSTDVPIDPAIIAAHDELYLQVWVNEGTGLKELKPRQKLSSVPYAMRSEFAQNADMATTAMTIPDGSVTMAKLHDGAITDEKVLKNSLSTASVNNSFRDFLIPRGMVAMFVDPEGCPEGWTRFSQLDNRFPMGIPSYDGVPGGAAAISGLSISTAGAHSHTVNPHSHPIPHRHAVPVGHTGTGTMVIATESAWNQGTESVNVLYSYFDQAGANRVSFPFLKSRPPDTPNSGDASPGTDIKGEHNHEVSSDGTWRPPYWGVVFCKKD